MKAEEACQQSPENASSSLQEVEKENKEADKDKEIDNKDACEEKKDSEKNDADAEKKESDKKDLQEVKKEPEKKCSDIVKKESNEEKKETDIKDSNEKESDKECKEKENAKKKDSDKEKKDSEKKDSDKEKKDAKKKNGDKEKKEEEKTLKLGNLSLPTSQQPGPLVSFGENIVDKDTVQLFLFGDLFQRKHGHFTDLIPSVLWGVNDQFSIFYNLPIAPSFRDKSNHSSGIEDVFIQFEYAFYTQEKRTYVNQATIVFNVTFPTGSSRKVPPTGFGASSCFIGATYNHTAIDWFYFGSIGSILTSSTKCCTKFGNELLYELGFGRNIASPKGWIYAWMIEIDGLYLGRNKFRGVVDPNSGGNLVFFTPSLWISNEKLIVQLGIGCPLCQHLFGSQLEYLYQVIFNVGYTF